MGLFYRVSDKELLSVRIRIFKEVGIPALEKKGFLQSPFKGAWYGEYDKSNKGHSYQFCRISKSNNLEILDVSIFKGDKRINFYICVFELHPRLNSIHELKGYDGIPFSMIVKNKNKFMKLRSDDYEGLPLFYMLFMPEHKIGKFYTKNDYNNEVDKMRILIKADMEKIDDFVKRWHELHKPNVTDWEGNLITKAT